MLRSTASGNTRRMTMPTLQVQTLGTTDVQVDGRPADWHAQTARELFFFLLSNPEGVGKDEILEQLWGLDPTPSASNRFRVTVHRVRVALGRPDAIREEFGRYRASREVLEATDVHAFYTAMDRANRASDSNDRLALYQKALKMYAGDYLTGERAEWASAAREEHRAAYVRAALEVSLLHCDHGSCEAAVGALVRALRADPFIGENYHQKLMTCLSVVEGKYAAIEHYRRFLGFLRDELEDSPMDETRDLAERIKHGESICMRHLGPDAPLTMNCPLTPDGSCRGVFGELIRLA
jgi:two-component SAPR family response regulator